MQCKAAERGRIQASGAIWIMFLASSADFTRSDRANF